MQQNCKRFLAMVLAIVMVLTMLPTQALTARAEGYAIRVEVDGQAAALTESEAEQCESLGQEVSVLRVSVPKTAGTVTVSGAAATTDIYLYPDEGDQLEGKSVSRVATQ